LQVLLLAKNLSGRCPASIFTPALRPEANPETEYVSFDRPRVRRVLTRIIADRDELAGFPPIAEEESKDEDAEARRGRHRRRLAEPDPPPKRLSTREQRPARCALLDPPPSGIGRTSPSGPSHRDVSADGTRLCLLLRKTHDRS
jgi:hypothetical protein